MPPARQVAKTHKVLQVVWQKRYQSLKIIMRKVLPHVVFLTELFNQGDVGNKLLVLGRRIDCPKYEVLD